MGGLLKGFIHGAAKAGGEIATGNIDEMRQMRLAKFQQGLGFENADYQHAQAKDLAAYTHGLNKDMADHNTDNQVTLQNNQGRIQGLLQDDAQAFSDIERRDTQRFTMERDRALNDDRVNIVRIGQDHDKDMADINADIASEQSAQDHGEKLHEMEVQYGYEEGLLTKGLKGGSKTKPEDMRELKEVKILSQDSRGLQTETVELRDRGGSRWVADDKMGRFVPMFIYDMEPQTKEMWLKVLDANPNSSFGEIYQYMTNKAASQQSAQTGGEQK